MNPDDLIDEKETLDYKEMIKELKQRESELKYRTEAIEGMMRTLTNALSGLHLPQPSTSTPNEQPNENPASPFLPPQTSYATLNMTPASYSINSPYPKSYVRDALDLVPKYDGHNIPVWQFARACKRARDSIPSVDEAHFVRLLRNKLNHHAYLAVEDETHLTVDKFLDTLKRTFGPGRSSNYYRGQLSIVYKKPSEHILDYIGRIKDLRTAIIEGDQTNLNRSLTEPETSSIDSFTLEAFYEGLPREYRVELKAEGYHNLTDACSKVITISKRLEREEARERNSRPARSDAAPTRTLPPTRILQRDDSSTNNAGSPYNNREQKICGYCKNFGHLVHECRKRQYHESTSARGLGQWDAPRSWKGSSRSSLGLLPKPVYILRAASGSVPSVELESPSFYGPTAFMLDTGAQPNIIKQGCLQRKIEVNNQEILQLTGITEDAVNTLGSIQVQIFNILVTFHVVPDDFPIIQQGILGTSFFTEHNACIDYSNSTVTWHNCAIPFKEQETVVIPPRTNTGFVIRVSNPEIKTGYLPRLHICDGVFAGDSLVTCINNKAYIHLHSSQLLESSASIKSTSFEAKQNKITNRQESLFLTSNYGISPAPSSSNSNFNNTTTSFTNSNTPSSAARTCSLMGSFSRAECMRPHEKPFSSAKCTHSHSGSSNLTSSHFPSPLVPYKPEKEKVMINNIKENDTDYNKKETVINKIASVKENMEKEDSKRVTWTMAERISAVLKLLRLDHLVPFEKENVITLVTNYCDRFYIPNEYLDKTQLLTHKIITTDDAPVHTKQYRFPPIHRTEITQQVNQLIDRDVIIPSTSPYNSPIWIVPKKPDSSGNKRWRMVIDYRKLNEKTIGDAYPLPNICDILDQLGGSKYFSVLDLASGFHQIPMDPMDAHKTAFSTPHGHYQFARMPFGLKNAPATFQRLMDQVLSGLQGIELFVYMDDIVIYASSLREHDIKIDKLMSRLRSANLTLQPDKCEFLRREVSYLGHIIGEDGVRPDPQKISAVEKFPAPRNIKNIRQFLGLAGYYRRFIPQFSSIASPLSNLLKKDVQFIWNDKTQHAFDTLRKLLCNEPILQFPDFEREFILTTDASNLAIGGVLSQGEINHDLPIAYASRVLNSAEKNYSTIEKELLAITYCVNHFRPYLYGRTFTLITDHQPLTWLHRVKDPTSRLMRWRLKLEEFDYKIVYKKGISNSNADALSRNPVAINLIHYSIMPIRKKPRLDSAILSSSESDDTSESDDERSRKQPAGARVDVRDMTTPVAPTSCGNSEDSPIPKLIIRLRRNESPVVLPAPTEPISSQYELRTGRKTNFEEFFHEEESDRDSLPDLESPADSPAKSPNTSNNETPDQLLDSTPTISPDISLSSNCKIQESPLPLLSRTDNLIILITGNGHPLCDGAQELLQANNLPPPDDLALGRARVHFSWHRDRHVIMLPVKERRTTPLDEQILDECLTSLLDVVSELDLRTLSIRLTAQLDSVSWSTMVQKLQSTMIDRPITITICKGITSIPLEKDRIKIINEHHESAVGGHKGVTKTYRLIKKRYSWPNMKTQIQDVIRRCHTCQLRKLVRKKTRQPMILTDTPDHAFDKIALDIVGPLKTTNDGNTYILTMQDLLTKYSVYAPLSNISAESTATAFVNYFICRFGCPRSILTDQGRNFMSQLMKSITKKFRIQQLRTTAYYPQSNGSLERSHMVLMEYLRCFVRKENDWDKFIERASFSYNTSVHEGTGFTPHELIFGSPARIPSEFNSDPEPETYGNRLMKVFSEIRDLQRNAKENLDKAKQKSKTYYDKRVNAIIINPGDSVFLINNLKTNKFVTEYLGPYKVVEVMDHENVRLEINGTTRVVHTNKLKRAYPRNAG
ncbi:uncharacterized protein LOC118645358 [Monomorium pharaonis]|uniref:uncharacterized protein LOC118645358 n=1 Tax=Monomorium pharaonis TaxID=307658 RepID=UPI001747842F|nr:uncharacterized protein LOC118645358 [Monomorium pharaonis]